MISVVVLLLVDIARVVVTKNETQHPQKKNVHPIHLRLALAPPWKNDFTLSRQEAQTVRGEQKDNVLSGS